MEMYTETERASTTKKKKRERERSAANMAKCLDEKIAILETCLYVWNTLKDSFYPQYSLLL